MNAHAPITAPLTCGPKSHSEAVTALEAALKALREAATFYKHTVNDAAEKLDVAVDAYNAAVDKAGSVAREMRDGDEFLELFGPDELFFDAPPEWPVDVETAARQVATFSDLDAALEDAEDARRDYRGEMKHREDMSNPDRYL